MSHEICVICGRPAIQGWTCGNSYCQEADFHQNRARNLRKGTRAAAEAWNTASEKTEIAVRFANRVQRA